MRGIRLLRLLDVLPVTSARNAPGVSPRALIVVCERLSTIDQVLLNGIPSPGFIVYSTTQLLVQVPEVLEDVRITEIIVLSSTPSMTERSVIQLGVGVRITGQSGVTRLIQTFVRLLMRTAGTNVFHPTLGVGMPRLVGNNISSRLSADVAIAVADARRQLIAAQTPYTGIPPAERLLSAEVVSVAEDPTNAQINVTVVVTSHDRQRSAATLIA